MLTTELAKGLDFDSVVVIDPVGIEQASPRGRADLYVALTRTTLRLDSSSSATCHAGSRQPD